MTPEQINAISETPIHKDGSTFKEMFDYLVSDGWFWIDGEPPNGTEAMQEVMAKALEIIIATSKE